MFPGFKRGSGSKRGDISEGGRGRGGGGEMRGTVMLLVEFLNKYGRFRLAPLVMHWGGGVEVLGKATKLMMMRPGVP